MAKRAKKNEEKVTESSERLSLEETWPADEKPEPEPEPEPWNGNSYDPNAIPAESTANPENMSATPVTDSLLGLSSDGPFIAPAEQTAAPKRTRKPREVTPIRLAGVAETRIKRLREQSKGRIAMLEVQLKGEAEALQDAIGRVLATYPAAVQGVLKALGVIDTSYPSLEDAELQEQAEQASAEAEQSFSEENELPF